MFGNTFTYLKNKFFGVKQEEEVIEEQPKVKIPDEVLLANIDYSNVLEPSIVNPTCNKTLLVVDDYELTKVLYANDFDKIKDEYSVSPREDFKIVRCLDSESGLQAFKYIMMDKNKVDYALLDLTLGCVVKLEDNRFVEIDGATLAIWIMKSNPNAKIKFVTMHTMNDENHIVKGYINKLRTAGIDLVANYISKNSLQRYKELYEFLYKG